MKTKELQREYQRKWMAKRRNDWLAGKSCLVCGSTNNLEVDHIDRTKKKYQISSLWGMNINNPNRVAELAKCQVLCHKCHIDKTNKFDRLRGSEVSSAKLNEKQIIEACKMYNTGKYTSKKIAMQFGVHEDTIRYAYRGKTWKHLQT